MSIFDTVIDRLKASADDRAVVLFSCFGFAVFCILALYIVLAGLVGLLTKQSPGVISTLAGKRVFITGGSEGMGLAVATHFAMEGAIVVISARREEVLRDACENANALVADQHEAQKSSNKDTFKGLFGIKSTRSVVTFPVSYVVMDVSDMTSVHEGYERALGIYKQVEKQTHTHRPGGSANSLTVDILVCAAGFSWPARFLDVPFEQAHRCFETNYFGVFNILREVLPAMYARYESAKKIKDGGKGASPCDARFRVVIFGSMASLAPVAGYSSYAPTKAALLALAHCLDMESRPRGVSFQVVQAPDVDTPGFSRENLVKSEECARISSFGGATAFSTEEVGATVVAAVKRGDSFQITVGLEGWLLSHLCPMMQPPWSVSNFVFETIWISLGRLVLAIVSWIHYGIVQQVWREKRQKAQRKRN